MTGTWETTRLCGRTFDVVPPWSKIDGSSKWMVSFARSAAGQAAYEAALRKMRSEWRSVEDLIRVRVFGWKRVQSNSGDFAIRPVSGGWKRRVLEPNLYPYDVPSDVAHWILWSDGEAMTTTEVERYLEREAPAWATGWTWVRNPAAARSVPGIWHVQVFFRRSG